MAIEEGMVVFFNAAEGKRYGFISPDKGGPNVFFHLNDARTLKADDEKVVFTNEFIRLPFFPDIQDRVVFERAPGKDGREKACPWNYHKAYEDAEIDTAWNILRNEEVRATEAERNADLYEKASLADRGDDQDGILSSGFPDTVFTDHASDDDKEDLCPGCDQPMRDCECDDEWDAHPDDQEFENNSEPPDADAKFFDVEEEETPDIDV